MADVRVLADPAPPAAVTAEEFTAASIALLRSAVGWQSAIARRLDVDSRQVRRWLAADRTPEWVDERIADLTGLADAAGSWPRDEWLVGDTPPDTEGRRREYVVHLAPPRFIARMVAVDGYGLPEPDERPADILSGVVYSAAPGTLLCEIAWIDQPEPGQVTALLEAAADAIDAASG